MDPLEQIAEAEKLLGVYGTKTTMLEALRVHLHMGCPQCVSPNVRSTTETVTVSYGFPPEIPQVDIPYTARIIKCADCEGAFEVDREVWATEAIQKYLMQQHLLWVRDRRQAQDFNFKIKDHAKCENVVDGKPCGHDYMGHYGSRVVPTGCRECGCNDFTAANPALRD